MSDKDIVENYEKELAKVGLELPQDSENVSDTPEEPTAEHTQPEEPKETVEEPVAPKPEEQNPQSEVPSQPSQRKRTVYDDLKDKRKELRSEKELREQAERERDELQEKLQAIQSAGTPQERSDAEDELSEFAQEIGADPDAIRRMRELFLKGIQVPQDDSIKKDMEEFRQWKAQNSVAIEQQMFEQEFQRTVPTLKELFPSASQEELGAIKKELDVISHSKDWHDKELDYIAFKHKDRLSTLVSPKKRGMETSGRASETAEEREFDPSADVSSMTPKQREVWFEEYEKATQQKKGIITDASGKKLIV